MAALIQHKSGLFYIQFSDKTRRPQQKRASLKTKRRRTAEQLKARLERDYLLGEFDPWSPAGEAVEEMPDLRRLGNAADAYLASCAHLRPSTQKTYSEIVRAFVEHVGRQRPLSSLTPKHVLDWLNATSAGDVTRRKYTHHLGYFFRFCVRRAAMDRDLSKEVKLPRLPEKAPKAMSPSEVRLFLEMARTWPCHHYCWLADLVEANVELGLRRGELIALRREHVSLELGVLRVVNGDGFSTKSGKDRTIPLSSTARRVLSQRLSSASNHVFESNRGPLTPSGLSHAFRRVRRRAGLPDSISLHATRHTFATRLAEKGVPVSVIQQLMGHSSVTVTERYMHVRAEVAYHHVLRAFG